MSILRFTKLQGLGNDYLYVLADALPENAAELGLCDRDRDISVRCKGGELIVRYSEDGVTLTGDTRLVYTGEIEY